MRRAAKTSFLVLSLVTLGAATQAQAVTLAKLPKVTGSFGVGTETFSLAQEGRPEVLTPQTDDERELMVQIWYPVDAGQASRAQRATYFSDYDAIWPALSERLRLPGILKGAFGAVGVNARVDLPVAPAQAKYPVLVFSHGIESFRNQSTYLLEQMASEGYIVVAADHTYDAEATVFPGGRLVRTRVDSIIEEQGDAGYDLLIRERVADVKFLIATLGKWNTEKGNTFENKLDLQRLGVFGHSMGGATSTESCQAIPEVKGCLNYDGSFRLEAITKPLAQPQMFIDASAPLGEGWARDAFPPLAAEGYRVTVEGTAHETFTDIPLLLPFSGRLARTGSLDARRAWSIFIDYTSAFFAKTLKNVDSPLLDGGENAPAEVDVETKNVTTAAKP